MKRLAIASTLLLTLAMLALSGSAAEKEQTLNGYLIDVMCGSKHVQEGTAYGANHPKSCLLMPACVQSGYALLTEDKKLLKFDSKGNEEASKLINSTDREKNWRVLVTGRLNDDQIAVSRIKLAE